jgi:hypothetical protein
VTGPVVVQAKSASGTSSPLAVTLTSTAAKNALVACIGEGNSTTNPVVSGITLGGNADNWASAKANISNAQANAEIWTDLSCAGGQTAVSVAFTPGTGAGNGYTAWVFEISLIALLAALDGQNNGGAASGAWSSGSSGTPVQPSEVAVGLGVGIGSAGAPTLAGPSSPWNNQAQLSAARTAMIAGTQILTSAAAVTYSGTSSTGRVGAAVVTLKAAPSGNLLLLKFP